MKNPDIYKYLSDEADFEVADAGSLGPIYFPLVNEQGLLSAITPDLQGDIKLDQHSFLNIPVAFEDLHLSRASRNFWLTFHGGKSHYPWSVSGRSVWQRASDKPEKVSMKAGILWQEVKRTHSQNGVEVSVLNFVPPDLGTFEVMFVEVHNSSQQPVEFTATAAIPLYGRSADNLRDHRHVTSLLNRMVQSKFGLGLKPTMSFNEKGHNANEISYWVLGCTEDGKAPVGFYPDVASFVGVGGDLEKPHALLNGDSAPAKISSNSDGAEALGGLKFPRQKLAPGARFSFTLLLGIDQDGQNFEKILPQLTGRKNIVKQLEKTEKFWRDRALTIHFQTGDVEFNRWIQWVQIQPLLRKIYGNSYLPDFDYGRGGRGWRDLWQDCLALLLVNPEEVRTDILRNFGGVRIDGSNATIIGRKKVGPGQWTAEFIGDRNNITRVWMDHGVWPFLTALLYINQTGDAKLLNETVTYFRDGLHARTAEFHPEWNRDSEPKTKLKLTTKNGQIYEGTVLEHILVQNLVQFFNVGEHNIIRLEDADWNDGLDMASERGESVAFAAMYAGNLELIAQLLETTFGKDKTEIKIAEEIVLLLDRVATRIDYDSIEQKKKRLSDYFHAVAGSLKGTKASVPVSSLVNDLRDKAQWLKSWINQKEWIEADGEAWYNGYYDNEGRRVEGKGKGGKIRMTLTGQVYPIMAGLADKARIQKIVSAVNKHLYDKELGSVRLNTNFGGLELDLGRAFGFAFGEKENGAVFSHMVVMYANSLYQQGFSAEGYRILGSLYQMAKNSGRSRIFPGLPEYFNNSGQGRYAYLTGSASWYVLTLLTQVFGVRGDNGNLVLAPQLEPQQFDKEGKASVQAFFGGTQLKVVYHNPKRLAAAKAEILKVKGPKGDIIFSRRGNADILIQRELIKPHKELTLHVEMGPC